MSLDQLIEMRRLHNTADRLINDFEQWNEFN